LTCDFHFIDFSINIINPLPQSGASRSDAALLFAYAYYANYSFVYLLSTRSYRPLADWWSRAVVLGSCWAIRTTGVPEVYSSWKKLPSL